MDSTVNNGGSDSQNIATKAAALLLVIGEPFSENHKKLILEEVTKGFGCWETEVSGIDINDELAEIANKADLGEEGPDGERVIRQSSEKFVTDILINPQVRTLSIAVNKFLATPTKHKHLIHAGHAFQGTGAWILQDDTYTVDNFVKAFKGQDVSNSLKQQEGSSLSIYTGAGGDWTDKHLNGKDFAKNFHVKVNPSAGLDNVNGVLQFTAYVSNFVKVRKLNELLQSTDVVGNISFSRPTLYIFPGSQGDSALFGLNGFNLLVNGGYSRKACFWEITRHIDRIDAALVTHLGTDNVFGLNSVLQRKSAENVHPEIGYMYINASDKIGAIAEKDQNETKEDTLSVNLAEEGNKLIQYAKQIGQLPQPCTRNQTLEPINLYHKVGIGSMDMYILNPITDSKELKEFYQQWNQKVAQFGTSQNVPLPNNLSVCALLVWRPSDPNDNITRIFFPGNAPQHKVLEGLEKLKTLNILKSAKCTHSSLNAKPAAKKPSGLASKPPARSKVSPLSTPKSESIPKTEPIKKMPASTRSRPLSAQKAKKEDSNKKASKVAEKVIKNEEKTDKAKSSTSSSPSKSLKSSTASTPKETVSPTKEPELAPLEIVQSSNDSGDNVQNHIVNGGIEPVAAPMAFSSAPLQPEPVQPIIDDSVGAPLPPQELVQPGQTMAMDKEQLKELGIYDEDQDIEEDLNAQSNDQPEADRVPQMYGGMTDSMHEDLMSDIKASDPMQSSFHGDLMTGSMHESFYDDKQPFDGFVQNGGTIEEVATPEDDTSEEIQPQALPEPMAYTPASYSQEPDVIPVVAPKEESELAVDNVVSPAAIEPDLVPAKQELVDDVSLSQDVGEQSTVPIEDSCDIHAPPQLETPDEVENVIPEDKEFSQQLTEDVQEKDITEENEKQESLYQNEQQLEKLDQIPTEEDTHEKINTDDILKEDKSEKDKYDDEVKTTDIDTFEETQNTPETPSEQLAQEVGQTTDFELEKELQSDQSLEQEIVEDGFVNVHGDTLLEFERPKSPEPSEAEQDAKPAYFAEEQVYGGAEEISQGHGMEPEPLADNVGDNVEADMIKNDYVEEDKPNQEEPKETDDIKPQTTDFKEELDEQEHGTIEMRGEMVPGSPDSQIDRSGTPDSQVGTIEMNRDSLEKEKVNEQSPSPSPVMPVDQRDSIEREVNTKEESQILQHSEPRDSIERSFEDESDDPEGDDDKKLHESNEREVNTKEESPVLQDEQREPRDSIERSFEQEDSDDSEEDDDDEDDDSSSFEQEENTDEKCLIPVSASEGQECSIGEDDKAKENDSSVAPPDSLVPPDSLMDQLSDNMTSPVSENMYTPESEVTDQSHGGQLGYHQMGDQDDADSFEGLEDKSELSPQQQPLEPVPVGYAQYDQQAMPMSNPTNPFDLPDRPGNNPFTEMEQQHQESNFSSDEENDSIPAGGPADFNPVAEWGEPMGLPSPAPPEDKGAATARSPRPKTASKTPDSKKKEVPKSANGLASKTELKKPSATKKTVPSSRATPKPSNGEAEKSKSKSSTGSTGLNTSRLSQPTPTGRMSLGGKTRPSSAPGKDKPDLATAKSNGIKRPATASSTRASQAAVKMPPLPPFTPFYMDLTYIPNHGNTQYSDVEFFKRVRARYYVLSSLSPNTQVLDALLDAKNTWEDKDLPVTVIPTYDNETLSLWMALHKDKLADQKVDIAPSANRCTIQLHETSCSAYRLEF